MSTPDEQERALSAGDDVPGSVVPDLPLEADGADVLEQSQDVPLDDDEGRD